MGTQDTLIEDNLIEWCGWADAERAWEAAGAKFHRARNMLFRRNVIRHIRHANALWLDSGNANCRITGNVFADVLTVSAAIHMEMNRNTNQIDNNVDLECPQRRAGHARPERMRRVRHLHQRHAISLIIAQNLIGRCDNAGVFAIVREDRTGQRHGRGEQYLQQHLRQLRQVRHRVPQPEQRGRRQRLCLHAEASFWGFSRPNRSSGSTCRRGASRTAGTRTEPWRPCRSDFDPDRLELTMSSSQPFPKVSVFNHIDSDMFGKVTGEDQSSRSRWPTPAPSASGILTLARWLRLKTRPDK